MLQSVCNGSIADIYPQIIFHKKKKIISHAPLDLNLVTTFYWKPEIFPSNFVSSSISVSKLKFLSLNMKQKSPSHHGDVIFQGVLNPLNTRVISQQGAWYHSMIQSAQKVNKTVTTMVQWSTDCYIHHSVQILCVSIEH